MGLSEYKFGFEAESRACEFLVASGFEILTRNFHSKFGEIDIVAKKAGVLHFVEVKATGGEYEAVYRLTPTKFRKIQAAILHYISTFSLDCSYVIDLVCVEKERVNLLENISF